ncbi:MAG: hypothetical protein KC425_17170, partial [Anaerolineales bacterium]|nr:hypothetical protein [Anaerolineales bacterium]
SAGSFVAGNARSTPPVDGSTPLAPVGAASFVSQLRATNHGSRLTAYGQRLTAHGLRLTDYENKTTVA